MNSVSYPNPQAIFYQQYEAVRRDEIVGILLALFLGTFGIHHFYLRRTGLGILYCCLFWSGIPALLGFIECFFIRNYPKIIIVERNYFIPQLVTCQFFYIRRYGQPASFLRSNVQHPAE